MFNTNVKHALAELRSPAPGPNPTTNGERLTCIASVVNRLINACPRLRRNLLDRVRAWRTPITCPAILISRRFGGPSGSRTAQAFRKRLFLAQFGSYVFGSQFGLASLFGGSLGALY